MEGGLFEGFKFLHFSPQIFDTVKGVCVMGVCAIRPLRSKGALTPVSLL